MQRRNFLAGLTGLAMAAAVAPAAFAQTAPLNPPVTLTVGYPKVAHLAPMILIADKLKAQGVDLKLVEFARYADARTALQAGSLDIAAVGPADLPITLAAGSSSLVGIMGIGSSPKYVIGRNGVKLDSWDDIKGKKIAIAPGSAVWFQFAATLTEKGIPYNSFQAINIQGGGANFDAALEKGEVDAIVTWEPFESIPIMKGYGFFAKNLDYSASKAVGAELGMLAANKEKIAGKDAAVQLFVTAYVKEMKALEASPAEFGKAIQQLTGLDAEISRRIAEVIKLGPVVTPDQLKRQAKAFADLGVITKDVSGQIDGAWNGTYLATALKQ
ncbi:MAG: ABC transporter substrate-binding protein [Rhizobiales bacterium 35-68-8]|nr:MAG: ABC transporter substrate-binding protein [Rhizobiales bacterium 35-68-8]